MTQTDWRALADGVSLVATDLDGTLLRADQGVSSFTIDTFARARAAGLPVVFVTGRPPRWIPAVVEATGHAGVGIAANGAVVLDLATSEILRTHPITPDVLHEVVRILRAEIPGIAFALEWVGDDDTHFALERTYHPRWPAPDESLVADIGVLIDDRSVVKLLGRVVQTGGGHDADEFLHTALQHVEHLVSVTHSNSDDVLIEMSALGVTKGSTLAAHAASLGLSAEHVAAVGDMPNDVPMLRWARVGLAIEGGHPSVLETADAVLPGPDDDGVARYVDAVLRARVTRSGDAADLQ